MRLYFTRHGESEANTRRIISNRDLPHPLTETGRLQAASLAEKLRGKPITRIYTSPIPRARETAEILSAALDVPLELTEALREPDCGVLEGRGDEETWAQLQYWEETWLDNRERDRGPEGGETYEDIQRRFVPFVEELVARHGNTQSEFILVTHGALMLYGLPGVLANVDPQSIREYGIEHTRLITIGLQDGKLVCLGWG
jgi:2,3-bisphosphoglycerate-dependent phosphoglycerate mutase